MEANVALRLVQGWGAETKDRSFIDNMKVDAKGGFVTKSSGAFFRYLPDKKILLVSGFVAGGSFFFTKFQDSWQEQIRASKREYATMGEGEFELLDKELMGQQPEVVLITKKFVIDTISSDQFNLETRWLLRAAYYWFIKRHMEVLTQPEEKLIEQAAEKNRNWSKRPW